MADCFVSLRESWVLPSQHQRRATPPLTAEADSYLETRLSLGLEHEMAAGAELTNQQALEHLLTMLDELQTDTAVPTEAAT